MDAEERARREEVVLSEYSGILPYAEVFYICSIIYAAEACFVAFARYQNECATESGDHSAAASAVHEALGHAAALSRFFWPARTTKIASARSDRLRQTFAVTNESPLRSRDLRNALEHYDEHLDEFLLDDCVGMILQEPVVAHVDLAQDPVGKIFKLLDPAAGVFVILGRSFYFEPIFAEVGRILDRAYDLNGGGGRLR